MATDIDPTELSEQEASEILRQFSESKANLHTFFTNVVRSKDTTKTGNLGIEELGVSALPFRTYKELALLSNNLLDKPSWGTILTDLAEIQSASSLSKDGFLMKLSVTSKKEQTLADKTPRKKSSSWFKKKEEGQEGMNQ